MATLNSKVAFGLSVLVAVVVVSSALIMLVRMLANTLQTCSDGLLKKTKALTVEQKRTDKLVHQLLPPFVALEYRTDGKCKMRYYESVTIYFSEIVGFREQIFINSTPLQIIALLNDLCAMYDSRIQRYDVQKIDMVEDTLMVASGFDTRKLDINHAVETARMALDILNEMEQFIVPHMPGVKVGTRIGLHTGPVNTGVLTTNIPRFCLFGNTVTTAAAVERSGCASKIHITKETCDALTLKPNGFIVVTRGKVQLSKNKLPFETFWLEGQRHGMKLRKGTQRVSQSGSTPPVVPKRVIRWSLFK